MIDQLFLVVGKIFANKSIAAHNLLSVESNYPFYGLHFNIKSRILNLTEIWITNLVKDHKKGY